MLRSRKLHHGKKRRARKLVALLILLAVIIGIYGFIQYKNIRSKATEAVESARAVKTGFSNNNIDEVQSELNTFKNKYAAFKKASSGVYWMRFIPLAGAYVSDFRNGVEAGDAMVEAAIISVDAIAPYADLIGFKKGGSFVEKSADDRIQTAVLTLDKVLVKVDDIATHVDTARKHIDEIDVNRYPNKVGNREVRSRLKNLKDQFDGVASLFVDAKPLIKKLPQILGTEEEKTYLVLFENDKELRPTGGFLTAYAIFKVKEGRFQVVKSADIYTLDDSIPTHPPAPSEILKYHKGVSKFFIRDSNLSPDFPESVKLFDSLDQKSTQKVAYDGIKAVDTNVLVDTLSVLGDTEVRGTVFSSTADKRCDCPQVIYKLLDEIDRPVGFIKENRKGILGDLLYALVQKALGVSPSQYWGRLTQELIRNLQEKHILVYLVDADPQKAIEAINFGGKIKDFEGDYLHVNDANLAGAKSNLFVNHTITSETTIKGDGAIERTVTIEYKNPYKHSDCSLERGGLCLNATLRNWLRVYVPKGSRLVSFQGSETKVATYDNLEKTVFEGFLDVKPLGKATVIVKYTLPFKVQNEKDYKLLIQKQPGTKGHQVIVTVNGRQKEKFALIQDKNVIMK